MPRKPRFALVFAPETLEHLDLIDAKHHGHPTMRIAPLADVKARLSAYVEQVETEGPIIITRNGKAVAVLLAPRDDDELERLILAHSPQLKAILDQSRASIRAGKGLPSDAFWQAVAERKRSGKS